MERAKRDFANDMEIDCHSRQVCQGESLDCIGTEKLQSKNAPFRASTPPGHGRCQRVDTSVSDTCRSGRKSVSRVSEPYEMRRWQWEHVKTIPGHTGAVLEHVREGHG